MIAGVCEAKAGKGKMGVSHPNQTHTHDQAPAKPLPSPCKALCNAEPFTPAKLMQGLLCLVERGCMECWEYST